MTCEVAVMNRSAVVIAADSAVTTTNSNGEKRYSKGANKIFQLSNVEPVGVMIYGSASISAMPWEVVAKAFRDEKLGSTRFDTVGEYATAFLDYIAAEGNPISQEFRDACYVAFVQQSWLRVFEHTKQTAALIHDQAATVPDRANAWRDYFDRRAAQLAAQPLDPRITAEQLEAAVAGIPPGLIQDGENALRSLGLAEIIVPQQIGELAVRYFYHSFTAFLGSTGVVIAGYGKAEYLPTVVEIDVFGFVGTQLVFEETKRTQISFSEPSAILQFAMSNQVDAFTSGVGLDAYSQVREAYEQHAKTLAAETLAASGAAAPADMDDRLKVSRDEFMRDWYHKVLAQHWHPMRNVVASLSVEEMAEFAETLVVLESLKERVTSTRQSVGGPIDVAVITKAEGLVWIKRKHFFSPELNSRFGVRQKLMLGGAI
ncbi:hypothetical protein N234_18840 [Ralstonia pickettii DTP0602]|nr:hypothetical protein N234_18840 [Ralstonia pickettii DTP0602]